MSEIEKRLRTLEKFRDTYLPVIQAIAKQLELSKPTVNPAKYCIDETDQRIIDCLIEEEGAGATEIATKLGLDPKTGRHLVGKRIKRLQARSALDGWNILEFYAGSKKGKFRAWWLDVTEVDVEAFRKTRVK